jgi:conjugation system TraG family ATPase
MIVIMIIAVVLLAAVLLQHREPKISSKDIDKILPVWKLEKDCIVSKNGDLTLAFAVTLPEIFSLSNEEYEGLHNAWLKAIKVLPVGTVLHKQDWFVRSLYKTTFSEGNNDFLKTSAGKFFNERPFLDHNCYLMLTLKADGRKPGSSAFSNLLRTGIVPSGTINNRQYQQLSDAAGQFCRILSDSGQLQLRKLTESELAGDKDNTGLLERYLFVLGNNEKPQIRDIEFKPDWKIGANYCQLYTLADTDNLPATCGPRVNYDKYSTDRTKFSVGFASPISQLLPVNHIYNQFLIIGDIPKTLKRLEAKRRRLQSLSAYSRENTISRDATGDFLNEAIADARTPIKAHFNLQCWTDDYNSLKELRNQTSSSLSKMDVVPHLETTGYPQLWWSALPGNEADIPENECFETFAEQASCFLNMETAYRSSKSSFGIRLNDRLSGVPIHVDISDEPMGKITQNRNKIVVGGSGSGKSMFMNHMLHSYVQQGAHCVVVDVGHSYEGLCELLDGYYFTYSEENPIKFNPFYIPAGEVLDTEKKESIKTLLVALWKQHDESFRRSEYVAISNALQSYYSHLDKQRDLFPCFDTFYEFLNDHFINELDRDRVKDRDFDVHNFLYVLRPFYKGGEFDYLLNARENLDVMSQPLVIFEIDAVKDHPILFPVIALIICELFISKMRKLKGIRKVIVIEEAWKAVAKAGMAEFMKYLYKTVRKYFGEAITVTQEIDDLLSSPIIKEAIINNADCKILLDLRKFQNKFDQIQEVLGMSDKGKALVLSLNIANDPNRRYREVYIELGNQLMKVYGYEPSVEEYYAYSTEQTEKLKVKEFTKRYGGDIRRALSAIAAEELRD